MKKKQDKVNEAQALQAELSRISTVILTTFKGITVADDTKLRRAVEAAGGRYKVVKNTVAERAGLGTPAGPVLQNLTGANSIAYTAQDAVALAKALTKVAKEVPAFQFRSGVVEGRVVSIAEITALASLPSRDELMSKIMFLLNAPAQRIASTISAVSRNAAVALNEAVKEKKFAE